MKHSLKSWLAVAVSLLAASSAVMAGEADVLAASATQQADGRYTFEVTVRHADTGWDHYANQWQILDAHGKVLATRTLHHPHVDEQPFTRSLSGVDIPVGVGEVVVRARDLVHDLGGRTVTVALPE